MSSWEWGGGWGGCCNALLLNKPWGMGGGQRPHGITLDKKLEQEFYKFVFHLWMKKGNKPCFFCLFVWFWGRGSHPVLPQHLYISSCLIRDTFPAANQILIMMDEGRRRSYIKTAHRFLCSSTVSLPFFLSPDINNLNICDDKLKSSGGQTTFLLYMTAFRTKQWSAAHEA